MSLQLDERQQAMLAELGVPLWWQRPDEAVPVEAQQAQPPARAPAAAPHTPAQQSVARAPIQQAPAVAAGEPVAMPRPQTAPRAATGPAPTALAPLPADIAAMDWAQLQDSLAQCQACALCLGRHASVYMAQGNQADWLVLGEPPDDAQERAGEPFVGDAGRLLDNMLRAVGVQRLGQDALAPERSAYLSLVLKCRPAVPTAPNAQALLDCAQYLQREIALVRPKVILAMGRLAMRALLSQEPAEVLGLPLAKLRGRVWHYQGVPVVVTYPPEYLLRTPQDKARAWQDLCLAQDVAQGRLTTSA
jgi:uracil-DNA glycosylase family 4